MNTSKEIQDRQYWRLLQAFNAKERKQLLAWYHMRIPAFQDAIRLYEVFEAVPIAELWEKAFPAEVFTPEKDKRFRKLVYLLQKEAEVFLSVQNMLGEEDQRHRFLLQGLQKRGLSKLFLRRYREIQKKLDQFKRPDARFFQYRFQLELIRHRFQSLGKQKKEGARWEKISEYYREWFLHQSMELSLHDHNQRKLSGRGLPIPFLDETIRHIESSGTSSPTMELHFRLYRLLNDQSEGAEEVLLVLKEKKNAFHPEIILGNYYFLINHFVRLSNEKGSLSSARALLQVYQQGFQEKSLLLNGFIPLKLFQNYMILLLVLEEYGQAEAALRELPTFLAPQQSKTILKLSEARYLIFAEKNYSKAIKILVSTRFEEKEELIQARILLLQAHYENSSEEAWEWAPQLRAIKYALKKLPLAPQRKAKLLLFVKYFQRLLKADRPDLKARLKEELQQEARLDLNRHWVWRQLSKPGT